VCHPQRMALLVYDMQIGICSQVKTANKVVTRITGCWESRDRRGCG
jgi:nicotinamidase-related amidase